MPAFVRHIGIDYSGAETPTASLKGLRVYMAEGDGVPIEILPSPSRRKYWTRRGIAEYLVKRLTEDPPALVGIDHGFSFPLRYFEAHALELDWPAFLEDFQHHWPTDDDHAYVDFVREGVIGNGAARTGNTRWRRLTDERARGAKSVFHFDVQGSVAKSTHAGIPWLRFIRYQLCRPRAFLAIRRMGRACGAFRHCRGLSVDLAWVLCERRSHRGPARRLLYRCPARTRRSRGHAWRVPEARAFGSRPVIGAGRGLDIGGAGPSCRDCFPIIWRSDISIDDISLWP